MAVHEAVGEPQDDDDVAVGTVLDPQPGDGASTGLDSQPKEGVETGLDARPAEAEVDSPPAEPGAASKKRSQWVNAVIIVGVLALVCSGSAVALAVGLANRYESRVDREDILGDVPAVESDERFDAGPLNFLVLGSDARDGQAKDGDTSGSRSDTIMIVHISKGLKKAFIFSIPRDSYVNVPAGGRWPGGKNKINAAFAYGGAKLAAKTVYELTKIPLDGAMIINFEGIHRMVAEVGTVNVCVPYSVRSVHTNRLWSEGCHDMGPDETEDFVRQRTNVPGGDFGRMYSQQLVVKALASKIKGSGMLKQPATLDLLILTAAESIIVDQKTNLRELILALKDIEPDDISFATTPYAGTMTTNAGSSVRLDEERAQELFAAVRADKAEEWLATHPQKPPGS